MQMGMGALRWSPDQFWRSTMQELMCGYEGFAQSKGISLEEENPNTAPMTRAEMYELERQLENVGRTSNPDGAA
jgi:uncharacterized phage protein (TIGR02216 family)